MERRVQRTSKKNKAYSTAIHPNPNRSRYQGNRQHVGIAGWTNKKAYSLKKSNVHSRVRRALEVLEKCAQERIAHRTQRAGFRTQAQQSWNNDFKVILSRVGNGPGRRDRIRQAWANWRRNGSLKGAALRASMGM